MAYKVFLWLAYGLMVNSLTSQAATMNFGGAPNDIVTNLNPIFIIIMLCPPMNKIV
jgi:POT family proton-dependent oligopeptide transporter